MPAFSSFSGVKTRDLENLSDSFLAAWVMSDSPRAGIVQLLVTGLIIYFSPPDFKLLILYWVVAD